MRTAALDQLPKSIGTDLFEIEARGAGNPTKDQMGLMMQSLLANRCAACSDLQGTPNGTLLGSRDTTKALIAEEFPPTGSWLARWISPLSITSSSLRRIRAFSQ
jgi:hypothetical protein